MAVTCQLFSHFFFFGEEGLITPPYLCKSLQSPCNYMCLTDMQCYIMFSVFHLPCHRKKNVLAIPAPKLFMKLYTFSKHFLANDYVNILLSTLLVAIWKRDQFVNMQVLMQLYDII